MCIRCIGNNSIAIKTSIASSNNSEISTLIIGFKDKDYNLWDQKSFHALALCSLSSNSNFLKNAQSRSLGKLIKNRLQINICATKSVNFVKYFIDLRVWLMAAFSWITEDIWLDSFLMQVLASLTIRTVSTLVILLARLSLILNVGQDFGLELVSTMSKAALISELASSSQFPVFTHFGLVFSSVFFNKLSSLFRVSLLSSGLVNLLRLGHTSISKELPSEKSTEVILLEEERTLLGRRPASVVESLSL